MSSSLPEDGSIDGGATAGVDSSGGGARDGALWGARKQWVPSWWGVRPGVGPRAVGVVNPKISSVNVAGWVAQVRRSPWQRCVKVLREEGLSLVLGVGLGLAVLSFLDALSWMGVAGAAVLVLVYEVASERSAAKRAWLVTEPEPAMVAVEATDAVAALCVRVSQSDAGELDSSFVEAVRSLLWGLAQCPGLVRVGEVDAEVRALTESEGALVESRVRQVSARVWGLVPPGRVGL